MSLGVRPIVALALAAASGCFSAADRDAIAVRGAAANGFVRIAACDLAAGRYYDDVDVAAPRPARQLVVVVERGNVIIRQLTVRFPGGRWFVPSIRSAFASDSSSRVITLPEARPITDVELDYGRHDDARVELWAR